MFRAQIVHGRPLRRAAGRASIAPKHIVDGPMTAEQPQEHGPRAHHDMGGVSPYVCREIDTEPHALDDFDREVDALRQLLAAKGLMTVDELRRNIEAIPEAEYHALSYYQRWIRAITAHLLRKGIVLPDELAGRLAEPAR
jgi:hypothetical protein